MPNNKRALGSVVDIEGRDYAPIRARIVPSMYSEAAEDETAIFIQQDKKGIVISPETLKQLLEWVERGDVKNEENKDG